MPYGQKYIGAWQNGLAHGEVTFSDKHGNVYHGTYKDGKKHGDGTIAYANGSSYRGSFADDRRQGKKGNFSLLMVGNIMAIGIKAR